MVFFWALPPNLVDSYGDWKPLLEIRERYEHRVNFDLDNTSPDVRSRLLSRWRVGFEASLPDGWKTRVVYQYSNDRDYTPSGNVEREKNNIREALFWNTVREGEWVFLGRQVINIDNQRLVGATDWDNIGRTWDALRYQWKWGEGQWDAFGAKLGTAPFGGYSKNAYLAGLGYQCSSGGHLYLFYKHDRDVQGPHVDVYTLNGVKRGTIGIFRYGLEASVQAGRVPSGSLQAWHFSASLGFNVHRDLDFIAETNWASGGTDNGVSNTFDQLYPTNHDKYGYADLQGLRNVRHFGARFVYDPEGPLSADVGYHLFQLYDRTDAWYGASGAPILQDPTGNSGRNVGSEVDFRARWDSPNRWYLEGGISWFIPGSFINNIQGQDVDDLIFWYVMAGWRY